MNNIDKRLNRIEEIITQKSFRENKGLGNEVGYYIFDYLPEDELYVRSHVEYLKNKIDSGVYDFKIIEFDLYKIVMNILNEKKYLEKCFKFEETKGFYYTVNAIEKLLKLTDKNNLLINHIVENTKENSVVFLTGIGKCYPVVRSHNVLNNLHQVLDTVPVVLFFPGVYTGQDLQLFGTVKNNYYRAFKLA